MGEKVPLALGDVERGFAIVETTKVLLSGEVLGHKSGEAFGSTRLVLEPGNKVAVIRDVPGVEVKLALVEWCAHADNYIKHQTKIKFFVCFLIAWLKMVT